MRTRLSTILICLLFAAVAYSHNGEVPEVIPGPDAFPKGSVDAPRRPGDTPGEFPKGGETSGPVGAPAPANPAGRPRGPDRPGIPKRGGKPRPASETVSPNHWSSWWMMNRDRYVDLRSRRDARGRRLRSGGSPHYFGEGSPRNIRPKPREEALVAAVTALESAAMDPNQHVATSAIIALGKSGNARAVPLLIRIGSDAGRRREERESALLALGMPGLLVEEVRGALVAALTDTNLASSERTFAALGLGLLADPATVPVLARLAFVAENQRDVPAASTLAAGLAGGDFIVPDLSRALSGTRVARTADPRLRAMAAAALGKTGSREALPGLRRALADADKLVRRQAVLSLGALAEPRDEEIVADLIRLLAYERDAVLRGYAAVALGEIGAAAGADSILYLYRKGNNVEVQFAALALGLLAKETDVAEVRERVVPVIRAEFAKDHPSSLQGALAISLGLARDRESVPGLIAVYEDEGDVWLRGRCATALGLIGADAAREPLRLALTERGDHRVIWDAAYALGMLGDEEGARMLIATLEGDESEYSRGAAALALGYLVAPEQAGILVRILGDPQSSDATRTLAAIALGRVIEQAGIPILSRLTENLDPALPEGSVKKALGIM